MPFTRKGIDAFEPKKMRLILGKRGGTTLQDWEHLDSVDQEVLRKQLQLSEEELPVIAMKHESNPLLITTKSIIWRHGAVTRLALDKIDFVDAPEYGLCEKADLHQLSLRTIDGETFLRRNRTRRTLLYVVESVG